MLKVLGVAGGVVNTCHFWASMMSPKSYNLSYGKPLEPVLDLRILNHFQHHDNTIGKITFKLSGTRGHVTQ